MGFVELDPVKPDPIASFKLNWCLGQLLFSLYQLPMKGCCRRLAGAVEGHDNDVAVVDDDAAKAVDVTLYADGGKSKKPPTSP
jgi:hypothetical protein